MTQSSTQTGDQTLDATPYVLYSQDLANNKMIRIEARYNCIKDGDYSLIATGKVINAFTRTTGTGLIATSTDQDKAEIGNSLDNMSTTPTLKLVPNAGNNQIDVTLVGTSDTLNWQVLVNTYSS